LNSQFSGASAANEPAVDIRIENENENENENEYEYEYENKDENENENNNENKDENEILYNSIQHRNINNKKISNEVTRKIMNFMSKKNNNEKFLRIKRYIDAAIKQKIYNSYTEFFIIHFYTLPLTLDIFKKNIVFYRGECTETILQDFKPKFFQLLEDMDRLNKDENIQLFAKAITGTTYPSQTYTIRLINDNRIETYATCSSYVRVSYPRFINKYFRISQNNRETDERVNDFIENIKAALLSGGLS